MGYQECIFNYNGKIWCFWKNISNTSIIANDKQQISIKIENGSDNHSIIITAIYGKCTALERRDLWSILENINLNINGPWCIGSAFNVILDPGEKLGGKPHMMHRSLEFQNCMDICGTTNIGYTGPKFTWCNNIGPRKRIWNRLDRVFINDKWAKNFQNTTVRHLLRSSSDHRTTHEIFKLY